MYYDLIASLPHLPHFAKAERMPITPFRLEQRLRLLKPAHAEQLGRAKSVSRWRPERVPGTSDGALAKEYAALMESPLDSMLRAFVAFRMDQQTLLAAMRRKNEGIELPGGGTVWGAGPRVPWVQRHFSDLDFRLAHVYPWLPQARQRLASGDALGLERLLMDVVWRWLDRCAEQNLFGFEAVFAYFFKWDLLQAWLVCDADLGKARFRDLIEKVIDVRQN